MTNPKPPKPITDPEQIPALLHALRHELVQPVHTLGLLLDLMPAAGDKAALAAWSQRSLRALDNLKHMLKLLGEVAKLDLQPPARQSQRVRLSSLFEGLVARHRELAERCGSRLRLVASGRVVLGDPDLLRLGLDALVENALCYGSGKPVLIGAKRQDGCLLLGVWDQGPGLDEDEFIWLKDDFRRGEGVDAAAGAGTGLGLGLGLARRVAHLMGGELWLRSAPGHGSCAGLLLALGPSEDRGR